MPKILPSLTTEQQKMFKLDHSITDEFNYDVCVRHCLSMGIQCTNIVVDGRACHICLENPVGTDLPMQGLTVKFRESHPNS